MLALTGLVAAAVAFSLTRPKPGTDASPATASGFLPTKPNTARPLGTAPEGMVWIPGGEFSMGSDTACETLCGLPGVTRDAVPIHRVYVDGFWMDKADVTNERFQEFVNATGYVTVAERAQSAGAGRPLRPGGAGREEARSPGRLVPVHRPVLHPLHGRHPRQG